jgi:hypothetical protein
MAARLCERLSQGDIFPPQWDDDIGRIEGPIVVITHNCEIDKTTGVLVADYVLKEQADPGLWGALVKNASARGWLIPDTAQAGYVNFRTLRALPSDLLNARLQRRMHSMTADGRDVLALKLYQFLRRHLPNETYDQAREDQV